MKIEKIFAPFLKKLEVNLIISRSEKIRTIISFKSLKDRDSFIQNRKNIKILSKYKNIPSILIEANRKKIFELSDDNLIEIIQEDQRLYQAMNYSLKLLNIDKIINSLVPITGKGISIALLDSGVIKDLESLDYSTIEQINLTNEEPSDENFHATLLVHILKNISVDYGSGFLGFCPNVKLYDFKVVNNDGVSYISDFLKAFEYILEKKIVLDVVLLTCSTLDPSRGGDILSNYCDLIANKLNTIIVTSAGNFGPELGTIGSPGSAGSVITVGASSKQGTITYFSGNGFDDLELKKPEIHLPGSKISVPIKNLNMYEVSGSSISAAICAGIIVLLRETNSEISKREVIEILNSSKSHLFKKHLDNSLEIVDVAKIFDSLGLYQERPIPYSVLARKALLLSIYFIIAAILLFFLIRVLDFILI